MACEICGSDECLWEEDDYFDDDWEDQEADVNELIRIYRVNGVTVPEGGRFGTPFTHVTLARNVEEAKQKVAYKIPPFAQFTAVYPVN